jgi:hypothetical protein
LGLTPSPLDIGSGCDANEISDIWMRLTHLWLENQPELTLSPIDISIDHNANKIIILCL